MPEHTETLREIAEGMLKRAGLLQERGGLAGGKEQEAMEAVAAELVEQANRIEKLRAEADADLVKKWSEASTGLILGGFDGGKAFAMGKCADQLKTWLAVNLPRIRDDVRTEQDAKWTAALGFSGVLGPETVAKQVEHEKAEVRLEEAKWLWQQDFVDAYNGGLLTEKGRDVLRERIASLAQGAKSAESWQNREII